MERPKRFSMTVQSPIKIEEQFKTNVLCYVCLGFLSSNREILEGSCIECSKLSNNRLSSRPNSVISL